MRTMLKLTLALCSLILISEKSGAAVYSCCETVLAGGTVNVVGGGTNTYTDKWIDASKQENIPLELTFKSQSTNTLNLTLTFKASIDGSTAPNAGPGFFTWVVAGNGTNSQTIVTNFAALGYGKFLLSTILNGNADVAVTNVALRYAIKRLD